MEAEVTVAESIIESSDTLLETTPVKVENLSEWLDFVARIIEAVAWPIVVIVAIFLFKSHLIIVLGNLKSFKWGGGEATFDRDIKVATEQAKAIETVPEAVAELNRERLLELIGMAAVSPTGAIVEAWKDIEQTAQMVAEESEQPFASRKRPRYFELQRFLEVNRLLPSAEIQVLKELRMIRNRAAHSSDTEVTVEQARQYVHLADRLVDSIKVISSE